MNASPTVTLSLRTMFEYEDSTAQTQDQSDDQEYLALEWESSEYEIRSKSFLWYAGLYGLSLVLVLALIILHRENIVKMISAVLTVLAMTIAIHFYSNRKPKLISYVLSEESISVNNKIYPLSTFKSFSVIETSGNEEIRMRPDADTSPPLTIKLSGVDAKQVFNIISNQIPYKQEVLSLIEKIINKINF